MASLSPMPKPKSILLQGFLPVLAGLVLGHFFNFPPWMTPPPAASSPPSTRPAGGEVSAAGPKTSMPPLGSAQASADAPPANKDQLLKLIRNFRVEDLLAELSHLPPGEERRMVIKLLALVWFRMDRPGAPST